MSKAAIGIDLGTTNCAVAYVDDSGQPKIIKNCFGNSIIPSVILFSPSGELTIGIEAKQQIIYDKGNTFCYFKRDMGTDTIYPYKDKNYSPVELSSYLLENIKKEAEEATGLEIQKAVITVPAYFRDRARLDTKTAAEKAGLEVLNIINEPTAAALAYGLNKTDQEENVLVYDLGGGTFDVSLVQITRESINVIGTDGNHNLGGKDWDDRLANYVCEEFEHLHGVNPLDEVFTFQEILGRIEDVKKSLSYLEKTHIQVSYQGLTEKIELSRQLFNDLTKDLLGQTEILMQKVLDETGYSYSQITGILMVGGSTRMPMVRELIERVYGHEANCSVNPDECVALGAAIKAKMELQSRETSELPLKGLIKLQDVTSHSLGMIVISADGKKYENAIILPKNRPMPAEDSQIKVLKTSPRRKNKLEIYILQGESKRPLDNTLLGKYTFNEVPHYTGNTRVKVEFKYDSNGIVSVEAYDEKSMGPLSNSTVEIDNMDISWTDHEPEILKEIEEIYVILCIDTSSSMEGSKLAQARSGALNFMKNLDIEYVSVGLVSFDNYAQLQMEFTKSLKDMKKAVKSLVANGGTNMTDAIETAHSKLKYQNGRRVIVLLTDGYPNDKSSTQRLAEECTKDNIEIITLGTDGADRAFLKKLATNEESQFFTSSKEIESMFGKIAQNLSESKGFRLNPI